MRSKRWRIAVPVVALMSTVLIATTADARVPRCFGQRATIVGTNRSDVIRGTAHADVIVALGGGDSIKGRGGSDRICAGNGKDRVVAGPGEYDVVFGEGGGDEIHGGGGFDVILGGSGNDVIDGGRAFDLASFAFAANGVTVDLLAGTATGEGSDTLQAIEDVEGSPQNDSLTGDAGENFFYPEGGDDSVDGGDGNDSVLFLFSPSAVTVDLTAGTATGEGSDTLTAIENVNGSDHNDVLNGDAAANNLYGNAGADTIDGMDGDDSIYGGSGDDTLDGGLGSDTTDGGADTDTCLNGETVSNCEA